MDYRKYLRERKDKLHDREEKLSYIRSNLGMNKDGVEEPEDDTNYTYVDDRQTNDPNETLMARVHDAEYRDMEDNYAAKKMAVKKAEAEYEKDKLEDKIGNLEKSDKKLEKLIKKIRKTISAKDSDEEETEEEQPAPEETETEPEKPAEEQPEQGEEQGAEETPEQPQEKGEESTEGEEEEERPKNILNKKLDLSWTEKKGRIVEHRCPSNLNRLFERLYKDRVIRDGKTKIKYKTDRADDGFKVSVDNEGHAREEKMSPQEMVKRKRQQRIAQRKRDPKLNQMTRKRLRSARMRRQRGLDD